MDRYRKKPVVIDAEQWWPGVEIEGVSEVKWTDAQGVLRPEGVAWIPTSEGIMAASAGDWIIRGIKGELYPCKPDIFEATYERVED